MDVPVFSLSGQQKGTHKLPARLTGPVRTDVIRRAVLAERSHLRQPYGADPMAGKRTSAHYHGLRHYRYSMMNREMARMPRIHGRVGYLASTARFVPQATKGREAHPPVVRSFVEKINKKERLFAVFSAIAAGTHLNLVTARGHNVGKLKTVPLIIEDQFSTLTKAKDARKVFVVFGLEKELDRLQDKKTRAGRGKSRGRRTIVKKGPVVVVHADKGIGRGLANMPGVDVVDVKHLRVEQLAPGGQPGRLLIFTESALKELEKM